MLSLDLGTQTGWAVGGHDGIMSSGTKSHKPSRFEGGGMRYLKFTRWLDELHSTYTLGAVYFEAVRRHLGVDVAHVYGGFLATLSSWCENSSIPYSGVAVGTIKKHITGKGNASKQAVIKAVEAKGYRPQDDNEADAIALLDYVLTTHQPQR